MSSQLPPEIWAHIFSFLPDLSQDHQARFVCKCSYDGAQEHYRSMLHKIFGKVVSFGVDWESLSLNKSHLYGTINIERNSVAFTIQGVFKLNQQAPEFDLHIHGVSERGEVCRFILERKYEEGCRCYNIEGGGKLVTPASCAHEGNIHHLITHVTASTPMMELMVIHVAREIFSRATDSCLEVCSRVRYPHLWKNLVP